MGDGITLLLLHRTAVVRISGPFDSEEPLRNLFCCQPHTCLLGAAVPKGGTADPAEQTAARGGDCMFKQLAARWRAACSGCDALIFVWPPSSLPYSDSNVKA